jgi:hypothetical protein
MEQKHHIQGMLCCFVLVFMRGSLAHAIVPWVLAGCSRLGCRSCFMCHAAYFHEAKRTLGIGRCESCHKIITVMTGRMLPTAVHVSIHVSSAASMLRACICWVWHSLRWANIVDSYTLGLSIAWVAMAYCRFLQHHPGIHRAACCSLAGAVLLQGKVDSCSVVLSFHAKQHGHSYPYIQRPPEAVCETAPFSHPQPLIVCLLRLVGTGSCHVGCKIFTVQ